MNSTGLKHSYQYLALYEHSAAASSTESPIDTALHISTDVIVFIEVLYFPLTIVSNGVVIISTTLDGMLRQSPTDFVIIALSAADFLVGAWSIPIYILDDIPETTYLIRQNRTTCIMRWFASLFTQSMSLAMLFLLSLDRLVAVKWPLFYARRFSKNVVLFLTFIMVFNEWIVTYVMITFHMPFNETETNLHKRCNFLNTPEWYYGKGLTIKNAAYVIPAFVMTIETIRIARRHWNAIVKQSQSVGVIKEEKQNNVMFFLLMAMFMPFVVPSLMLFFVWEYMDFKHAKLYNKWARPLRLTNSAINSLVFAYSKKMCRHIYWFILTTPPTRWYEIKNVRRQFQLSLVPELVVVSANTEQHDATMTTFSQAPDAIRDPTTASVQINPNTLGVIEEGVHSFTSNFAQRQESRSIVKT